MHNVVRRMSWAGENHAETEPLLTREWLVANGLGGYASGTVAGMLTRRLRKASTPASSECTPDGGTSWHGPAEGAGISNSDPSP
jgi:hypothetical protein